MDVAQPHTVLSPTLEGTALRVLARTSRPLTGRQIARLAERSQKGVQRALDRLVAHGLVEREEAGAALLYTLNRRHLAAPAVEVLAGMRAELIRRLGAMIEDWDVPPIHASVFGSAARGDGDTDSDIDLFIVRPEDIDPDDVRWRNQLDYLASEVQAWTGNHVGLAEVSIDDVERLRDEQPAVVGDLRSNAIAVFGVPASELLKAAARTTSPARSGP